MKFFKVSCAGCAHCEQCPRTTRMYVNYCGTHSAKIMDKIRSARTDCFSRKGHTLMFNRELLPVSLAS
jgi:hypothetical protein